MGANDVATILRLPGLLVKDPTSLASVPTPEDLRTASTIFGGTVLGVTRNVEARWVVRSRNVVAEEWGGTVAERVYIGESLVLAAVLRNYDADAMATIFPRTSAGSTSGARVVEQDFAQTSSRAHIRTPHKILFVPVAVETTPLVYLPAARALHDATAKMALGLEEEVGIGCVWQACPNDSGVAYRIALREDLTL